MGVPDHATFRSFRKSRVNRCLVVVLLFILTIYLGKRNTSHLVQPTIIKPIIDPTHFPKARILIDLYAKQETQLLTLFTTFDVNSTSQTSLLIQRNVIRSCAFLVPAVNCVLYTNTIYDATVELLGDEIMKWKVHKIPVLYKHYLPVLRYIFIDAMKNFKSHFYMYANGDVLFDESLVLTLEQMKNNNQKGKHFIIGRRVNHRMTHVDYASPITNTNMIRDMASGENDTIYITQAEDFFITEKSAFPWEDIPDFVVGRRGYDNWLVEAAFNFKMEVVDASNSILCVHQTDHRGDKSGIEAKEDPDINMVLAKVSLDYSFKNGKTDCATSETILDRLNMSVALQKRKINPCFHFILTYFNH